MNIKAVRSTRSTSLFSATLPLAGSLLAALLLPTSVEAARGRPIVDQGTVRTDTGTLLRGPRVSLDRNVAPPTSSELQGIRNRGGNALHVYAERKGEADPADPGAGPVPGYKMDEVEDLVELTRDLDMYLVITVGNTPGSFDHDFTVDFWNLYAAAFGDDPHVIFEVQNEPYAQFCPHRHSAPSPIDVLELERDAYCAIRSHAPESMVLLFSYAMFNTASGVLSDAETVDLMVADPTDGCGPGTGIDWSLTAIAFHGYDSMSVRSNVEAVTGAGYGVVQTEFGPYCEGAHCGEPGGTCFGCDPGNCTKDAIHIEQLEIYEELEISWLSFLRHQTYLEDTAFKDRVDEAELLWLADFGTWPASSSPPVGTTVALFSETGMRYVSADTAVDPVNPPLRVKEIAPGLDERFGVFSHGPGTVALWSEAHEKYVAPGADLHLRASSTTPAAFEWFDRDDGRVALRPLDGLFVAADYDLDFEAPLVADRIKGGGEWSAFVPEDQTNHPPVANPDPFTTPFETDLVVLNTTLTANDEDPDPGDEVSWVTPQVLHPEPGDQKDITQTVLLSGEIEISYSPPDDFTGTVTFTYRIEDNHGLEAEVPGQVTIQVLPPESSPPVPADDRFLIPLGETSYSIPHEVVVANDEDPNGDPLWITGHGQPAYGTVFAVRGTLAYQPAQEFWDVGSDAFTYDVTDGHFTEQGMILLRAEPVCDLYLSDDFESGGLGAWHRTVANGGGTLAADPAAAFAGTHGLLVAPASGTIQLFVEDLSPDAERFFQARFQLNPNAFSMPAGAEHNLFTGFQPGANAFTLRMMNSGGAPQLRLTVSENNNVQVVSAPLDIADDAWHRLFVEWWAASGPGQLDGGARLWIDGVLRAEILGADNDQRAVGTVRLGAVWGLDPGTSGTYFVDDYASCAGPAAE